MMLDLPLFTALVSAATLLLGLLIYYVFYYLFQALAGRKIAEEDTVKKKIIMSGFIVENPEFPSITTLLKDIFSRSFRRGFRLVERVGSSYVFDWYLIGYILVLIILLVGVLVWMPR
ncbi:hypothetical protein ACSU1N_04685 [Thermogladius sp. 4427co]|uniref:hypothetical protein n=1 Tax=Thermogladius sp. 4427co TaxID=3450718 RepID=UPI003F79C50F